MPGEPEIMVPLSASASTAQPMRSPGAISWLNWVFWGPKRASISSKVPPSPTLSLTSQALLTSNCAAVRKVKPRCVDEKRRT